MKDTLLEATTGVRTSLATLKRKTTAIRTHLTDVETAIIGIENKIDRLISESESFKERLVKEANNEFNKLESTINDLKDQLSRERVKNLTNPANNAKELDLRRASTVCIFESILRQICRKSDDFELMCHAFIFKAVYSKISDKNPEPYLLEKIPPSATRVVDRGREFLDSIREVCETHLTYSDAWVNLIGETTEWWKNEALPLLYGERHSHWDEIEPLSLEEMETWKKNVSNRPFQLPGVYDAFENYRALKDSVQETSGVMEFEIKAFSYGNG